MSKRPVEHIPEKWWLCPSNSAPEVFDTFDFSQNIVIHDATLRDGEQTPGVVMYPEDKLEIAKKLDEIGVERIEAGMPAVSKDDFNAIRSIADAHLKAKIYSFARTKTEDIDSAIDAGVDGVVVEIPIGYPKLLYQFGWTWEDVLRRSVEVINYAKNKGLHVIYFPYDTTRARMEDFSSLMKGIMRDSSPDSIGIVDTMGCALPEAIKYLVRYTKNLTGLPIEIHTHNDFGLGLATELAAVEAGASVVHGAVNGLGERTGNTATEELIMALSVLYQVKDNYRLDKLVELGDLVERITGVRTADNKPVVGRRNFTRESGIGVDLVMKNPMVMFATDPRLTGREGNVVLGKKSGKLSILYQLEKLGYGEASDEQVLEILTRVKAVGIEKRSLLSDEEFKKIAEAVL